MSPTKKHRSLLSRLGPGFITGASDDDPSGIATYAQTGAQFGYTQSWMAVFTLPFMVAVQEMCGRIGLVTGTGLAGVLRKYYAKPFLWGAIGILLIANTINIGADLGAMAAATQLIAGGSFIFWLIAATILTLVMEIFITYQTYAKYLKYLTLSLFAYIAAAIVIRQPWATIAVHTLIPTFSLDPAFLLNIVAFLGTTISPYLFFWQADEEVEEEVAQGKLKAMGVGQPRLANGDIRAMRIDTFIGMLFSNVITFFIIVTAASTLGANGITQIDSAAQAAEALRPLAGDAASLLFSIGIIGTGLLAVPVLAGSASYAIAESFRWHEGLYLKLRQAHGFYGVITIATLGGLLINFTSIPPFRMLYYTAVLNGVAAPPLILLILLIANNKKIMRKQTNGAWSNVLGIIIAVIMTVAAGALLWTMWR